MLGPRPARRRALDLMAAAACAWALPGQAQERGPNAKEARAAGRTVLGRAGRPVALLLPRGGGGFEQVARALVAGVAAALERDAPDLWIETIPVDDEATALAQCFAELDARRFELALGPVTRKGVSALLELGPLPLRTVALSQPEHDRPVARTLTLLGLAIEAEAQQAATHAMSEVIDRVTTHRPRAAVVLGSSALARRAAQGFEEGWRAVGGEWRGAFEWGRLPAQETASRLAQAAPDVVYAALDGAQLRRLRPMLGARVTTWATSMVHGGSAPAGRGLELDGVYLMEMPYQVEPDNPAVVSYPRAPAGLSPELQRIYALGVDALRVGRPLLAGEQAFEMDGLTGWLRYDAAASPRVQRAMVPAVFRGGEVIALAAL